MKKKRANYKKGSTWREGNTVEKRSSIVLGLLNINGWNDVKKNDIVQAMEAKNVDIFSLVETKKKPHSRKIEIAGCKVFETRRDVDTANGGTDKEGGGLACVVRANTGISFSKYEPKIRYPELNYVSSERLWIKYSSAEGKSAICTVYMGFQASDNRHRE